MTHLPTTSQIRLRLLLTLAPRETKPGSVIEVSNLLLPLVWHAVASLSTATLLRFGPSH